MPIIDPFAPQQEIVDPFAQSAEAPQIVDPFEQQKEPEKGGFLDTAAAALKERAESFLPAAKLYTGLGDQKQATEDLLKAQSASDAYKQTEFSDIGKAFKAGNYGDALSQTMDKFKEVAGSSFGSMAPAIAAGEAGSMVAGPLGGIAAFGLTALGSYIADNIGRQKQEQEKSGDVNAPVNSLSATAAATGQTALDLLGFKIFKPLGALVGLEGEGLADKAAKEIVEAATDPKAYRNAVAKGVAEGIAFEVPQEVTQQVLERWQAGLPLNPFSDPDAAKEYLDAAGGALMLGGPMGAVSNVMETRALRQQAQQDKDQQALEQLVQGQQQQEQPVAEMQQAQQAPAEAQPVSEEVAVLAKKIEQEGGHDAADAEAIATQIVEDAKKAPMPAPTTAEGDINPELVADLTQQIEAKNKAEGWGLTPAEIRADALTLAAKEMEEDARAQRAQTGEANVGQPIDTTSGVSPELAQQPAQVEPAAGVTEPAANGVVPAGENVEPVGEGTRVEPTALTEPVQEPVQPTEEGAPVGAETTETVQAETQGQEPAPAAAGVSGEAAAEEEAVAKETKRLGRPPSTEEEKAAKAAARKQYRAEYTKATRQFDKNKGNAVAQLDEALKPLNEGEFADEDAYDQALEDQRAEKADAIKRLVEMEEKFRGSALGKKVKALLNDRTKISEDELAKVKRGIEIRKKTNLEDLRGVSDKGRSILAQRTSTAPADAKFNNAKNGAQALTIIAKTAKNPFQKFLAKRLLPFVRNVNFVVVEKGDALPQQLQEHADDWEDSRGLYFAGTKSSKPAVYVRGASFGDDQGVNNITVLHELLHAATNTKINLGMIASTQGFSTDAALTRFVNDLNALMENARLNYDNMRARGMLSRELRVLVESAGHVDPTTGEVTSDIFELPQEFLAYGMSDEHFQDFLDSIEGVSKEETGWSRFTRMIANLFGLGRGNYSALSDLMHVTDSILTARKTKEMRVVEKGMASEEEVSKQVKQTEKSQADNLRKLEKSNLADELKNDNGVFKQLTNLRNNGELADVLASRFDAFKQGTLREFLPSLMTDTLAEWADRLNIPGVSAAWARINDLEAARFRRNKVMGEIGTRLGDLQAKDAAMYKKLADTMHYSTLMEVDPTTKHTNSALNRMWEGLSPEAKKLYENVRDFYRDNYELYYKSLGDQVKRMGLAEADKEKVMAGIRQMYEDGKRIQPYFPLMRYGQYWARIGKGKSSEFHMFETLSDRELFLRQRARAQGTTKAQLIEDEDVDVGNDLHSARAGESSAMLRNIFESINEGTKNVVDDFGSVAGGTIGVDNLKDEIYQMFLQTLPERSFRKKFMHRQGKAGFSSDIHRNFVTTGASMINQVARVKYGPEITREIERAQASLRGNPDKAKLGEIVNEMRMRVERELNPPAEVDTATEVASRLATTSAFLWMMSSVKTAIAQFSSLPVFVAPVLSSKHGVANTAMAMGKWLNVFNGIGIKDADGNWSAPTIGNLKGLTEDQKKAVKYMNDRNISEATMAFDIAGRRSAATTAYQSKTRKVLRGTANVMTSLFHTSERMIREVAFMSSFDLNLKKLGNVEQALLAAEKEVHQALNNYHRGNRPRGIGQDAAGKVRLDSTAPLGRAVLQFKMFPAFVTTYFLRNGWRMTAMEKDPEVRRQARIQLVGSLMMSTLIAGTMGIPGFSLMMGLLQGLLNYLRGEDDDDPFDKRDLELWFRNVWLPQTFGGVKIGNHSLAEIMDRGVITAMTGYDITSSLSMNNMWFPEMKDAATAQAQMQDYFVSLAGPGASLALKQIPSAIDYFHKGEILRGMEQLMPALVRAPMTAARYAREGATTAAGVPIKEADEFTTGQIIGQAMGFSTEGLQAKREALFKVEGQIIKAKREKAETVTRLEKEILSGSDAGVDTAFEKVFAYNNKNFFDPITKDTLDEAAKRRMKRRFDRGMQIDKKYYPQVAELLEPSSEKLDRETNK